DRYRIDLAIVSAPEAVCYDPVAGNRALAAVLEHTGRLYGYVTINPRRLADTERDLREYLPTGKFVGAKLHTDYTASPVTSPQPRDALAMLAELDCPALVHTWDSAVADLAEVCLDIPRLRVIAGHMGAGGYRLAIEAANACDRVYLEPCWSHAPAGAWPAAGAGVAGTPRLFRSCACLTGPVPAPRAR